jgi:hypothetical protein
MMRIAILAAVAAISLGFFGNSTVSAAPAYGTSMGAAAAELDLISGRTSGGGRIVASSSYGLVGERVGARTTPCGADRADPRSGPTPALNRE